jgi:hypothetical protein
MCRAFIATVRHLSILRLGEKDGGALNMSFQCERLATAGQVGNHFFRRSDERSCRRSPGDRKVGSSASLGFKSNLAYLMVLEGGLGQKRLRS